VIGERKSINVFAKAFFVALDVAFYNVGVYLTVLAFAWIRSDPEAKIISAYYDLTTALVVIPALAFFAAGLYTVRWSRADAEDYLVIFRAVGIATIALLSYLHLKRADDVVRYFPSSAVLASFFVSAAALCSWRLFVRHLIDRELGQTRPPINLLIIGFSSMTGDVLARIATNEFPRYHIVGYLDDNPVSGELAGKGFEHLGAIKDLSDVINGRGIEEVLIVSAAVPARTVVQIIRDCERHSVPYRFLPTFLDVITSRAHVDLVNYVPLVRLGSSEIVGLQAFLKRVIDLAVVSVLAVPAAVVVGVACIFIMRESRGSPIFKQTRVGRYGRLFKIYKLRTMVADAEKHGALTKPGDARITRVGRFLRRWSIDELPQLYNVFWGQMSFVGPRAVVPYVAKQYDEIERMSLNVRPGVTGLAQVCGRDELGFRDKSLLNLYYIRNFSLLLDLRIILRTIKVVLSREGTDGTRVH